MPVLISDLWIPAEWVNALHERQATFPSLFNSGVAARGELFDGFAAGPGNTVNIPFFKDITDQADEVQVENTAPATDNGQPSGLMVATQLNRVSKNSSGAMAAQMSGSNPTAAIVSAIAERRLKQRQTTLISILRGAFGTGAQALNAAAPLSANRLGGVTAEPFSETGVGAPAGDFMSPTLFVNSCTLLGELADGLKQGCFLVHPNIRAALQILDSLNFKTLQKPSDLPFDLETYRDVPMFVSNNLVRAGGVNGFVYDSYIISKGTVAYGEKPQQGDTIDVASLAYFQDKANNNEIIYDRTRSILHLDGMKWVGTPAGQSPSNAELGTVGNWNLVYQTASRVGAVAMRTNG